MTIDGVWTLEVYGPFGWEGAGVLFISDGQVFGGGNNHYSRGSWTVSDDSVEIDLDVTYFGTPRTLFGATDLEFSLRFVGSRRDGVVAGDLSRPDRDVLPITARLTRCG